MVRIVKFGADLFADGYKLVSVAAPIISIFFALAKWQDWSVMDIRFAEMSWAWVIAPFTVWFFIAYVRRWLKYQIVEKERDKLKEIRDFETALDELSKKFDYGNNYVFNANPWSDSEWDKWSKDVEQFLEEKFGLRERNLFKNTVLFKELSFADHHRKRSIVAWQLQSLRETIVRYSDRVEKWRAGNI